MSGAGRLVAERGVDGLMRDRTRPPGEAPIAGARVAGLLRLTQVPPLFGPAPELDGA